MGPPGKKRSGYSRRAQYGVFAGYAAAVAAGLAGFGCVALSMARPQAFAPLRAVGSETVAPLSRVATGGRGLFSGAGEWVLAYWDAGNQNIALRRALLANRRTVVEADGLRLENRQLKGLLNLSRRDASVITAGNLIGSTATSSRRFATFDRGVLAGVRSGQPVRTADGIIGRTLEAGPTTTRILLVTDSESVIPCLRARDGMSATVSGQGNGNVTIQLLQTTRDGVKAGDIFISSGSGGLYPANVPVAIATRNGSDFAPGRPIADPATTTVAVVEQAFATTLPAPPEASVPPAPVKSGKP